jgi:hypothetical protein
MARSVKILETVYHSDNPKDVHAGAAGDGSFIVRFKATKEGRKEAEVFVKGKTYFSGPATITESTVSLSAAKRYGLA